LQEMVGRDLPHQHLVNDLRHFGEDNLLSAPPANTDWHVFNEVQGSLPPDLAPDALFKSKSTNSACRSP
jgi:hypothetical protein